MGWAAGRGGERKNNTRGLEGAASTGRFVQVVPRANGVSRGPAVCAVVENSRGTFHPIQEAGLYTFIDWRIVDQPFGSIPETDVATGIAPKIPFAGIGKSGPLLHGGQQNPVIDGGEDAVTIVLQIRIDRVECRNGLHTARVQIARQSLEVAVGPAAPRQFVSNIFVERKTLARNLHASGVKSIAT